MILFSPLLLEAFYSNQFLEAQGLLRWMIWGVACRLVSWPLGYWLLARATPMQLFWLEGAGAILTMALTFALVPCLGLKGAGIAFVLGALIYGLIMILFIRRRIGRGISAGSLRWCGVAMVTLAVAQYLALRDWSSWFSAAAVVVVSVLSGIVYYLAIKNDTHA
jgi:PST family polysaccharide transporter